VTGISRLVTNLPPEQQALRAKCFHPTSDFVEWKTEEVEKSLAERFEKIVRLYPRRIAIKTAEQAVTYAELNAKANALARAIVATRGEKKEPIALLMDNGVDALASLIGALKAGKFFIPIDPSFPPERINYLLEDSQARLIMTNGRHLEIASRLTNGSRTLLNTETDGESFSSDNLGLFISSEDLAAILYTSGSTGEPKGVMQSHRSLLHATMRRTNAFRFSVEDRLILIASSTYQAVINILASLLNGARLCPFGLKEEGAVSFASWLVREQITIYHSSASLFRELARALTGTEDLSRIRLARLASETVTKGDIELGAKHFPSSCIFSNGLGSTETGVMFLYYIDPSAPLVTDRVPIGYPLQDMETLLLGEDGQDVGLNQVGEIAVRSRYLSPGYWRKPDLTRAKFRPDPEGGDSRIYLTGDLGKRLEDGCFELLGRKDFLVKVRGFRVETGDVEEKLSGHPSIKEATVIGRAKNSGDTRLVAYVVPTKSPGPSASELRRFLKESLPDYMIPSAFVTLDGLPRTPAGKLDRKALPDPGTARPDLDIPFVLPQTPVAERLARIWAEVLSLDVVGIHDNFFDLGGHSLAATRVVSQVIKQFQLELPLQSLFQSPTVAEMAAVITENQAKKLDETALHRILAELESLSDDDAKMLVGKESHSAGVKDR
jgi:amino acid adenylation domain-containing protein